MFLGFFPSTLQKFTGVNFVFPTSAPQIGTPFSSSSSRCCKVGLSSLQRVGFDFFFDKEKGWSTGQSAYVDSISFSWASCQCHLWCILSFADFVLAGSESGHNNDQAMAYLTVPSCCLIIPAIISLLSSWSFSLDQYLGCHWHLLVIVIHAF